MRGRKPIPNQLKVVRGTDQPCRMRNEVEVEKISKLPAAPKWVNATGRKIYRTKSDYLISAGILSIVDIEMFISFCHELGRYIETSEKLSEVSMSAVLNEKQEQLYNRVTKINRDAFDRASKLASEFGFTPISRMKFNIKKEETDPLQAIIQAFK